MLSALVIGTAAALPSDLRAAFSRAGVSHVLSVSGLHVGLVAAVGVRALSLAAGAESVVVAQRPTCRSWQPRCRSCRCCSTPASPGSNVATLRSVLMIVVFVAAVLVDRERHLIVSLAAAAIVILLTSPGSSLDISFQLSFVAVLGLVLRHGALLAVVEAMGRGAPAASARLARPAVAAAGGVRDRLAQCAGRDHAADRAALQSSVVHRRPGQRPRRAACSGPSRSRSGCWRALLFLVSETAGVAVHLSGRAGRAAGALARYSSSPHGRMPPYGSSRRPLLELAVMYAVLVGAACVCPAGRAVAVLSMLGRWRWRTAHGGTSIGIIVAICGSPFSASGRATRRWSSCPAPR